MSIESLSICPRVNGIYKITNTKTGRFYIGRSEGKNGFYMRWYHHRRLLRKNIHHCSYLQNSYNKYGESCFTFEVLEIKNYGDPLWNLESEYILNLKAMYFEDGYNSTNQTFAKEYPKIYRDTSPRAKEFELLDPDGNLIKGRNLTQFCEELGLDGGTMWGVVNGIAKSYKGYQSSNQEFYRVKKEYRLLSPEKELIIFDNMNEFARKIEAPPNNVFLVFQGKYAQVKGKTKKFWID